MPPGSSLILYVDDEPMLLEIGKLFLERSGECTVETHESATSALSRLHRSRFDAIISDYQMPGMDGLEFLKAVRSDPDLHDIPFILFTGKGREEVVISAINSGADFYLQKGGDVGSQFAELLHKIHQAIRRRESERAVTENQSLLSLAEKLTGSGSWIHDLSTGRTIFSDGFFSVFGVEKTDVSDFFSFHDQIHPDDRVRVRKEQERLLRGEEGASEDEYRIIHPDGSIHYIHAVRRVTTGPEGDQHLFASVQDITDRKQDQYEINHAHDLYQSLINASPDAIIIADLSGEIIFASPRVAGLFRLQSGDSATGENILSWIFPEDRPLAISCITRHQQGEEAPPVIYRLLRSDCSIFSAEVHSAPVHDDTGTVTGFVAVIRDNSEKVSQNEALRRANTKLNLLSSITRHDILNKITALRLYCSLIREEEDPAENQAMLEKVEDMAGIISTLVAFTGHYQNLGINTAQWISPGEVLEKTRELIDSGDVRMNNGFSSVRIVADPLFEKVIYNLLDNAVRYGEGLTTIRTGYDLTAGELILFIEDDGGGIEPALKEKIFERNVGHGTGLGLYLSREILSVTDLRIRETGTFGIGARFEILVPVQMFEIPGMKKGRGSGLSGCEKPCYPQNQGKGDEDAQDHGDDPAGDAGLLTE